MNWDVLGHHRKDQLRAQLLYKFQNQLGDHLAGRLWSQYGDEMWSHLHTHLYFDEYYEMEEL